jgi:raffinose/stachyose/melibiose transport system substrate-binding protein
MKRSMVAITGVLLATVCAGAQADEVTLRVWDSFSEQTEGMDRFIAAFETSHPDIKISRDVQDGVEMRAVITTALNSGTGPDIIYYDTGPGFAGVLAANGLLRPLDDLYDSGALDAIFPWTRERTSFDGVTYGVGNELEFIGVYYNRDLFKQMGLEIPTTYDEFLDICAKLKAANITPVAFGDSAGWPAYHTFSVYANNHVPKDELTAMIEGGQSWDDPRVVQAIQAFFVDMNDKGYFMPSVNAISQEDANTYFSAGMAGMDITGSWMISVFSENTFDTGIFFLPAPEGNVALPPAGLGSGYFVSSKTSHPEEAKEFISFLFDPANAHFWVEDVNVIPPYAFDAGDLEVSNLLRFAIDAIGAVEMGYNIDVLTPDAFNTAMHDGFQAVLAGDRTAAEQATVLQAAMEKSK